MSKVLTSLVFLVIVASLLFFASTTTMAKRDHTILRTQHQNSSSLIVGAVQIFPVVGNGNTPQQNVDATSQAVVQTVIVNAAPTNSNSSVPLVDFFNFPEFLFQANLEYEKSGVCSGDGTNSSGQLRDYCYPVPDAGSLLDCSVNTGSGGSPAQNVACGLIARAGFLAGGITVSVNVCELMPNNGTLFNTQVVIRNGVVLAKYRKFHPFFSSCFTKPQLELVTFDVKGKRFGVFTCFDILFTDPKMDLVKMGVKYFSYSIAIPLVGLPAVELFSFENKVTVVTSNANGGQSGVVIDGKAVSRCTASTGTCVAIYTL